MVAPNAASLTRFLAAPPQQVTGFLLYGSDAPQISARADMLAAALKKRADAGEVVRLQDSDLSADPDRLIVELSTKPLFGGRPIVWLSSAPAKVQTLLVEALASQPEEAFLIVQAPDLKKSHKLTQAFEAASYLAAIPCYGEDKASVQAAIKADLDELGHEIDQDALALLVERCDLSMGIAKGEARKLATFAGKGARITLADVELCLNDQQTAETFEAVDAALDGDGRRALVAFERVMASEQTVVPMMSAISMALQRLSALRAAMDAGAPVQQAVKDLRPPVFFKQQDALARQARLWTADALAGPLRRLNETLKETRLKPQLAEDFALSLLLDIARTGRQLQKR